MNNSEAPTPVMPKTAIAVASPAPGSRNSNPSLICAHEKFCGWRVMIRAHSIVSIVNRQTLTVAIFSIRP